jgi:hypothetical protein
MTRPRKIALLLAMAGLLGGLALAQGPFGGGGFGGPGGPGGGRRGRGGNFGGGNYGAPGGATGTFVRLEGNNGVVNEDTVKTARETAGHSIDLPTWQNSPGFKHDTFVFARIIFHNRPPSALDDNSMYTGGGYRGGYGGRGMRGWVIDYPDADLNVSFRLHQYTSLKVDPDCRVLKLTDPDLPKYPMIYAEHVENMSLSDAEAASLRNYLQNGGVLLINDTWGDAAFLNFAAQMRRVLPGRNWTELPIDHPLFHCVFDLKGPMNKLQVPTMQYLNYDYDPADPSSKPSRPRQSGWENVHFRAWLDDRKNISVLIINNSDVSDGWEREGENESYFHLFSEKIAYPLAVNMVYYFMTH